MLKQLTLTQFRNFSLQQFNLQGNVVAFTGNNGVGKTNILDAIYYLCFTKSYFNSKELHNVQFGTTGYRIDGIFKYLSNDQQVCCIYKDGKKQISLDKQPYEKISEHIGKFNAVMIAPDDTSIITGSSENRRKFFDSLLSIENPAYLQSLLIYNKILQQKNAYLKQIEYGGINHQLLDIYDNQLTEPALYIIQERLKLSKLIPDLVRNYYSQICNKTETANLLYQDSCDVTNYSELLLNSRKKDIEQKRASFGPHTDDWDFLVKNVSIKHHASQGQKKSYLISLKLAQLALLQQKNIKVHLLLDDIFEKLDLNRLQYFFDALIQFNLEQIILTHTNSKDISNLNHPLLKDWQNIIIK